MARSSQGSNGKTGSNELARVIRERREELGMSRQELADATGIPYPTIAQIETAYRGVSPSRLGVIARALGLDPKELYDLLASDPGSPDLVSPDAATLAPVSPDPVSPAPISPAPISPSPASWMRGMGGAPAGGRPRTARPARSGAWFSNPGYDPPPRELSAPPVPTQGFAAGAGREPTPVSRPRVVAEVLQLLNRLPVDERIEALGDVQSRLLEGIVDEQVRRSPHTDREH